MTSGLKICLPIRFLEWPDSYVRHINSFHYNRIYKLFSNLVFQETEFIHKTFELILMFPDSKVFLKTWMYHNRICSLKVTSFRQQWTIQIRQCHHLVWNMKNFMPVQMIASSTTMGTVKLTTGRNVENQDGNHSV